MVQLHTSVVVRSAMRATREHGEATNSGSSLINLATNE